MRTPGGLQCDGRGLFGATVNFNDQSTAAGSTVTQWTWDFGDGTGSNIKNPVKTYARQEAIL